MNLPQSRANLIRDALELNNLRAQVESARASIEGQRGLFIIVQPSTSPGAPITQQRYALPAGVDWDSLARNPLLRGSGSGNATPAADTAVAKPPSKARFILPGMGGLFLLFGLLMLISALTASKPRPSVVALAPTPIPTPQPTVAIGPPHAGLAPPSTLSVRAGSVSQSWNITSYAEESGSILIGGTVRTSPGLAHFGKYPGERGNMVLAGSEQEIGQLRAVAVNDSVEVTARDGRLFLYRIISCDPKTQHKECLVGVNDDWALGWTPRDEQVGLVEDYPQSELTIIIALTPSSNDPTNLQNYVLRARLYGTKAK